MLQPRTIAPGTRLVGSSGLETDRCQLLGATEKTTMIMSTFDMQFDSSELLDKFGPVEIP